MMTIRDVEATSLMFEAVPQLGDVADVPAGALLWLAHLVATVTLPIVLAIGSSAAGFLAGPLSEFAPDTGAAVLALLSSDPSARLRNGAEAETQTPNPVSQLYRVTFGDEHGFRMWAERVIEFTSALEELAPDLDPRPVVFVQLRPPRGTPPVAYVSAGARGLASNIAGGAKVDASPVELWELPDGLTMLFGDGVDAAAYERRAQPARRDANNGTTR